MKNIFFKTREARALKKLARENKGKELSVLDDMVFKIVLSSNDADSKAALRSLISVCTRREVSDVQVLNSELHPAHLEGKKPRLDVLVTFNDGETADLEMQTDRSNDDLKRRAEYCTALLFSGQNSRGVKYRKIKRVYQVFFLDCIIFPKSKKLSRRYFYQEEEERDRLSDATEIVFYELPRVEHFYRDFLTGKINICGLTHEERWCMFMKYHHEERAKELIEGLCQEEEGIMHAEKAVTRISRDYKRYIRKMNQIITDLDHEMRLDMAEERGLEKAARNLLAEGSSIKFIQRITGLDIERIECLKLEMQLDSN